MLRERNWHTCRQTGYRSPFAKGGKRRKQAVVPDIRGYLARRPLSSRSEADPVQRSYHVASRELQETVAFPGKGTVCYSNPASLARMMACARSATCNLLKM